MTSPRIPEGLEAFLRHAQSLHPANNPRRENGFAKEFQQLKDMSSKLKRNPEYATHHGELDCNRPKNRYKDIMPFDRNRIILPTLAGVPGSDYINGNYVKGPDGENAYLALQGPLPRTVDDFWRLIASHKCQIVIMVCREIEMGKLKCKRYWPESKDEVLTFAGLEISLIDENNLAEGFVMRTMCMKSGKGEMTVTQLQYTAWPDHDVPRSAAPLIELNRTLRAAQGNRKQVVLIHCSAGCGRTGTIIAVDFAWTLLKMKRTDNFSVYDIVAELRRQRMAMVQTKEQYALVYKAVMQLVQEEIEKEEIKSHTYVNLEIPAASQSPTGREDYENCEFAESVRRWKQSDLQNGSVSRKPAQLPAQKQTKTKPKPQLPNKPPFPRSQPDGAAVVQPNAPIHHDYVNLEFNPEMTKNIPASPVGDADGAIAAQPLQPAKSNASKLNLNDMKGGSQNPVAVQQKSPTISDYEVVPKKVSVTAVSSSRNEKAPQGNKVVSADYEFPSMCAPHVNKEQAKHVPEGLLIDLGEDVPPVPSKRHSVGSVTKDGSKSRYANIQVPVQSTSKPGVSAQSSISSPNVLDDSWLFGLKPTVNNSPAAGAHLENAKGNAVSRSFHTVPNRTHADSGPKRCLLTAELFQDPGASAGGGVPTGGSSGLGLMQSSQGQYCLVGATSPPSPTRVVANPQSTQDSLPRKPKHTQPVEGHNSPLSKRQSDHRAPVGTYSLVGIPEVAGQSPVLQPQSPVITPTAVKSAPPKENTGMSVEVKSNPSIGLPVDAKSNQNIGDPVQVKSNPDTNVPVKVKGNPIVEPSYEIVGQRQLPAKGVSPPSVPPYKPRNAGLAVSEAQKGAKEEKQKTVAENKSTPDVSFRGQADGAQLQANDVAVGPDLYATVVPRNTKDKADSKDKNSPNVSPGSLNLRPQTSSGSLQSCASTSSEEGDAPPAVPKKTNEAFLVPGEEPYEHVQQSNRGTLDRFRKIMKSTSKGSLPKRSSDGLQPHGIPRSNSSGTGTTRLDELGYKKRFAKPTGPRSCPADWPSFGHLGL